MQMRAWPVPMSIFGTLTEAMCSQPDKALPMPDKSRRRRISRAASRMASKTAVLSQCPFSSEIIHRGSSTAISRTGNSKSISESRPLMSSSVSSRQLTTATGRPYFSSICFCRALVSGERGEAVFKRIKKGLPSSVSSRITRSSASSYSSRGMSVKLPSVVSTRPRVEWSVMTFRVPTSAAMLKGTSSSNQGVRTIRGASFSKYPKELGTMYPTQSMSRTRAEAFSSRSTWAASSGINLGSVVIMVLPAADWGSSSVARSLTNSLLMWGMTRVSMNFLIKVLFPVRTGPTIPI